MARQIINVGAAPNDGTGDPLRAAMIKANDNFAELYAGKDAVTVANFAALPDPTLHTGERWWVLASTGMWLTPGRHNKGAYYSDGVDWIYLGDFPQSASEVSNVPAGTIVATDVQSAINELDGDIGVSNAAITALQGDVTTLDGRLDTAEADIGASNTAITALQGDVTALDGRLDTAEADIVTLDGRLDTAEGNIVTLQADVAALGSADPLDLTVTNPAAPPAGTVRVFRREIAGRQMPAFIGSSGVDSALQPLLARNKVGYWNPPGNATTVPGVFGFTNPTITGFSATGRNITTTNRFTRMRRLGYNTAATAGTVGQWRVNAAQYTTGGPSGLGGFTYIIRFGISGSADIPDARMFMGMKSSTTPTNVEPSTLTQCVGMGHGAADTNMQLFYGGSVAQTPIDLGPDFPANTRNTDPYELALFSPPNSTEVTWQVTNLRTGVTATGTISGGAAIIPQETQLLTPWGYRTNNASAIAASMDVMSAYIETDF